VLEQHGTPTAALQNYCYVGWAAWLGNALVLTLDQRSYAGPGYYWDGWPFASCYLIKETQVYTAWLSLRG